MSAANSMLAPSVPSAGSTAHRTLRIGDWGEEVSELQQRLVAWLAESNPHRAAQYEAACRQARRAHGSGQFGPMTQALVAEFQAAHQIGQRGVVDSATWDALASPAASSVANRPSPTSAVTGVHPRVLQSYQQAVRTLKLLVVHRATVRPHPVVERWREAVAAYFPVEAVNDALRTIFYESSGRPYILHWNRNSSVDAGLFQMNSIHRGNYGISTSAEWTRVMATAADVLATPTPVQVANNIMAAFILFAANRGRFGRSWVAARKHGIP